MIGAPKKDLAATIKIFSSPSPFTFSSASPFCNINYLPLMKHFLFLCDVSGSSDRREKKALQALPRGLFPLCK